MYFAVCVFVAQLSLGEGYIEVADMQFLESLGISFNRGDWNYTVAQYRMQDSMTETCCRFCCSIMLYNASDPGDVAQPHQHCRGCLVLDGTCGAIFASLLCCHPVVVQVLKLQ